MFQTALSEKRRKLLEHGVLLPVHAGVTDHQALFLAGHQDLGWHPLKDAANLSHPRLYSATIEDVLSAVGTEIVNLRPRALLLTISEMWTWCGTEDRLRRFIGRIGRFSDDIHAVLHLESPAVAFAHHFGWQVASGRSDPLRAEADIAGDPEGWWLAASKLDGERRSKDGNPRRAAFLPNPTLAQRHAVEIWRAVLGAECVRVVPIATDWTADAIHTEMRDAFDLSGKIGRVTEALRAPKHAPPGKAWLKKAMALNAAIDILETDGSHVYVPHALRAARHEMISPLEGDKPLDAADLAMVTEGLHHNEWAQDPEPGPFEPMDVDLSFDPEPYLADLSKAAQLHAARSAAWQSKQLSQLREREKTQAQLGTLLSPDGHRMLNDLAKSNFVKIKTGRFAPRDIGQFAGVESQPMPSLRVMRDIPQTGTVVIACMKDEAPYILEWVAHHKAIGVDHFVVFTNDCSDGTDEILGRLQELGHLTHVDNSDWKGKSPQQAALNKALKMDVVSDADWLIHIDVDEFINIRTGTGTLQEVFERAGPAATNIAMTWRLFGNGGIEEIGDGGVMETFTRCAPSYMPKPHTMWGFKTITRNKGYFKKLSCHRPNQPTEQGLAQVKWLNGSLKDITAEAMKPGTWRSSVQSVGYDILQLNHYALRSRKSYLIKRARGRALHTDRTIGLNYWVRHDWNSHQDLTILRHVPRMKAIKEMLLGDPDLAHLHQDGLTWHNRRIAQLSENTEFATLDAQTRRANLTDVERIAYVLAADMES